VEAGIFFDPIEEVDSRIVSGASCEPVERFCKYVVQDNCFRKLSAVYPAKDRQRGIM